MAAKGLLEVLAAVVSLSLVAPPPGAEALHIGQLLVPGPIRNGSVSDVVLDCDFLLDPGEKSDGIVVKWFLNQGSSPDQLVYQWIPNHIPQDLGVLKGRVNLGYRATGQPSTRHRAINIINPTIELSGEYTCQVSSFYGEDTKAKKMIIYVPEDNLELTQAKTTEEGQVRLSCEADAVFPKPEITFLKKETESGGAKVLEGAEIRVTDRKDGLYDIEADIVVDEALLDDGPPYTLGCELKIPDANYSLIEWQNYETRRPSTSTSPATPLERTPEGVFGGDEEDEEGLDEGGVLLESMHRSVDVSGAVGQNARRLSLVLPASLATSLATWLWTRSTSHLV